VQENRVLKNAVTCISDCGRGLDWMIGLLDLLTSYTANLYLQAYSAIAALRTLQFTVTHALGFCSLVVSW
jgi:hypothetical protein